MWGYMLKMKINLEEHEIDTLLDWANGELEMEENQFTNKEHHDDYKSRVINIISKLKGEAVKE